MKLKRILLTMFTAALLVALMPSQAFARTYSLPAGDWTLGDALFPLTPGGHVYKLYWDSANSMADELRFEAGAVMTIRSGEELILEDWTRAFGVGKLIIEEGGKVTASGSGAQISCRVENSGSLVGAFEMGNGTNDGSMGSVTVIPSTVLLNRGTIDTASALGTASIYNRGIINNVSGNVFCAGLLSMELSSGTLEPGFTTEQTSYSATTDAESVTVTGVPCNFVLGTTRMDTRNDRVSTTAWETAARFEPSGFSSQSIPLEMGANSIDLWLIGSGGIPYPPYTITITRVASANAVPQTGSERQTPLMLTLALMSGAVLAYGAAGKIRRREN